MVRKIVFATNNAHKLGEMRLIAGDGMEILSLADIGCHDDIPETSPTLEGNALQKARWVASRYRVDCFADDTGLEVEALGGAPGVYSARYAGDGHDSRANMKKLLAEMQGKDDRRARFRTVMALIEGAEEHCFEGIVEGEILREPEGEGGFGYDPLFRPSGWQYSFACATADEKNAVSHRGRAARLLMQYLKDESVI